MKNLAPAAALAIALVWIGPADAQQIPDLFRSLVPGLKPTVPGSGTAAPPDPAAAGAPSAASRKSNKELSSELAPDIQCNRPRERFNVAEKVAEYGGTAASMRLQRILTSDMQHADLTAEDRQMLHYLAATTVWVPAEVEAKLGAIHDMAGGLFGSRPSLTPMQQTEFEQVQQRLANLSTVMRDYPAEIRLVVNPKLGDGAFARLGGVIQLSTNFLNGLGDANEGADFLLAHEVSHVYKRHAIKLIQFQMVSSSEGWSVARKVLQRASRGTQVDVVSDGIFALQTVPQLIEFVRSVQLKFGREQELEADACSTVWLRAIGTDPSSAWTRYHETLGAADTSYSLEHPSPEERRLRFQQKVAGGSGGPALKATDKGTVTKGGQQLIDQGRRKKTP